MTTTQCGGCGGNIGTSGSIGMRQAHEMRVELMRVQTTNDEVAKCAKARQKPNVTSSYNANAITIVVFWFLRSTGLEAESYVSVSVCLSVCVVLPPFCHRLSLYL